MFSSFLYALRAHGVPVGTGEWLAFLGALKRGLARDTTQMYHVGRALLCRTEGDFDAYDLAFSASFSAAALPQELRDKLEAFLARAAERPDTEWVQHEFETLEALWQAFLDRLKEQREEHHGGNKWVGTGGTSPFGHSGKGAQGIRIGGSGGGRQAVNVAMERRWQGYRGDQQLDVRNFERALRELKRLNREGATELDLDETIEQTARNAGDIELVERPERRNQLHVVLLMDAGGSMAPHYERVDRLFTAAMRVGSFRSLKTYTFHNCVYTYLYTDPEQRDRVASADVLAALGPKHRLIFVGDASMAPYELFSPFGYPGQEVASGLEWLQRFRARSRASVWLNPDPVRLWDHPTVSAISRVYPMFELTLDGLRQAVRKLRAPT